jgi:hypothetical protein
MRRDCHVMGNIGQVGRQPNMTSRLSNYLIPIASEELGEIVTR